MKTNAIGNREGESLVLQNRAARVEIVCQEGANGLFWRVQGDTNMRGPTIHASPAKALACAMRILAEYMQ